MKYEYKAHSKKHDEAVELMNELGKQGYRVILCETVMVYCGDEDIDNAERGFTMVFEREI